MIGRDDDEGISPAARRVLADLMERDIPLQVQHYEPWRSMKGRLCGSFTGQSTDMPRSVTCDDCRRLLEKRLAKAAKRRKGRAA